MQLVCRPQNLRESIEKGLYGSEKNHKNWGSLHSFPHMPKMQIESSKKVCVGDRRKIAALQQSRHIFLYVGWQYLVLIPDGYSGFLKIMLL